MAKKLVGVDRHVIFLVLIMVILGGTALTLFFALRTNLVEEVLKNDQIIKLLFVVEDGGEAVSTMILTYYPVSRRGALIDILGNTGDVYLSLDQLDMPNTKSRAGRSARIDAVYKEKGIDIYRGEIEKLVDTSIPFSIEISLDDFSILTDLLGGLLVSVPSPIDDIVDGIYYLLPSGQVTLDGDKIRTYIAYASEEEDSADRQERLQNTMVAFFKALNAKRNDVFRKDTFPRYEQLMRANIESKDLYNLLQEISVMDAERLFPQVITGSLRTVDGELLLFPHNNGQLIKEVFKQTVSTLISETAFSRVYALEIQNGTTVQDLARNTANLLRSTGYDVVTTINADRSDNEETYIIDHIGNSEVAKSLGDFIRCTKIITAEVQDEDAGLEIDNLVDFTLVLGKDFNGRYVN